MIGQEEFRTVMGHFSTGVTVVASRKPNGDRVGLTVNAFTSVSLEPPTVLVSLHKDAAGHDPLLEAGHFGVSILSARQHDLAYRFAEEDPEERFLGLDVEEGALGSPLIKGALAWLECRVQAVFPGGDHDIVLGEVVDCGAGKGDPLLFFRGSLQGMDP
jgi:3-hydroxy-9,10-secoandrosta-1,3,5(10)-triene-9,17-dione monooxygenase reductase component